MAYEKQNFTSGQVLTAAALNHMEDGIANAGGVSSWNDLTDKPFGVKTEMVEILPKTTKVATDVEVGCYVTPFSYSDTKLEELDGGFREQPVLLEGVRYKVVLDGIEYITTARTDEALGTTVIGGEYDIIGEGENTVIAFKDMPFLICSGWNISNYLGLYTPRGVARDLPDFTLAIYEEQEIIKKIDPKFLPDSMGTVVVLTEDDTNYTCNYKASELVKMYVENPGQLSTAKFVRRSGAYNLYVSYLTAVNCDPNGDSLMLLFNDMSIEVTPDSVNAVEDN